MPILNVVSILETGLLKRDTIIKIIIIIPFVYM